MATVATILIGLVAVLHIGFFVLESLLWTSPTGRKVFGMSREQAQHTAVLAKNQGVYNLFLAAGLIWSIVLGAAPHAHAIALFFLVCVVVAAVVGALTANPRILIVQGVPAIAALAVTLLA